MRKKEGSQSSEANDSSDPDWQEEPEEEPPSSSSHTHSKHSGDESSESSNTPSSSDTELTQTDDDSKPTVVDDDDKSSSMDEKGLGAARAIVRVPHLGVICYYDDRRGGYFLARCSCRAHREPDLHCQTSRRANKGRKAGQGRPLGWLMCWLQQCCPHSVDMCPRSRDEHVNPEFAYNPELGQRETARAELMELPGAAELADRELGGPDATEVEPYEFG